MHDKMVWQKPGRASLLFVLNLEPYPEIRYDKALVKPKGAGGRLFIFDSQPPRVEEVD